MAGSKGVKKPVPSKGRPATQKKLTKSTHAVSAKGATKARVVKKSVKPGAAAKAPAETKASDKKGVALTVNKNVKTDKKEGPGHNRTSELKKMLLARREAIVREAKDEIAKYISGETRQLIDTAVDEGDWASVDISEDINLMRLDAHRKLMLDIDEALRKIQNGTYGTCEDCGEEISEKRLAVMPTATLCISCKESREQLEAIERETNLE